MADYVAPIRKGTPRGEPVGFSQKKYRATLLALKGDKELKWNAKMLEVSYGLLRKWRSEAEFKSLVNQHVMQFSSFMREHISGKRKSQTRVQDAELIREFIQARSTTSSLSQNWNSKITPWLLRSSWQSIRTGRSNSKELKQHQLLILDYVIESLQDRNTAQRRIPGNSAFSFSQRVLSCSSGGIVTLNGIKRIRRQIA